MRERVCSNCGGKKYKVVGQNMLKCVFCGSLYVDEQSSKEEDLLVVQANELLRELKFDEAVEEFEKILTIYPLSFESYFGKALAKNKIVLYTNKRGTSKRPRFFGEKINLLSEDEDFKKALQLAPVERAKNFSEIAKRIDKISKNYQDSTSKQIFDCIFCWAGEEEKTEQIRNKVLSLLNEEEISSYCLGEAQKDNEENSFRALETSKIFLFLADSSGNFLDFKHLFDRYFYFVSERKKSRTSFIILADTNVVDIKNLPYNLSSCKSIVDTNSLSFIEDLKVMIKTQMEKIPLATAKIESVNVEREQPRKRKYINIDNISPSELGNYNIENVKITEDGIRKWIFLALKNADFETAKKQIEIELDKNPYNSEILLANLMAQKGIKTREEFFGSIANFQDKEQIENILKYASKDFAENFVDDWEKLIEKIDDVEYYNAFILFLASFKTSNRGNFIESAKNKAVETLDQELIDKVSKCFGKEDVDKYIEFYSALAQESDNQDYYNKILEIDAGHEQSNIAILLQRFQTTEEKLSYRNKDEIEGTLKFFDEPSRVSYVNAVVDMIMPVAFVDLQKAEKQLDFYISYLKDGQGLLTLLEKIATKFQEMRFFKQAEKYIAIAISKSKNPEKLYWQLIKIKCHCCTDQELIVSPTKPSELDEWKTLLEISDDTTGDLYAQIISKNNLYKGERAEFVEDTLDRVSIIEKVKSFIIRNEKILIEIEKQEEKSVGGVNYYRMQMKPFEDILKKFEAVETFETYEGLLERLFGRLKALNLTLDTSISVLDVMRKSGNLQPKEVVEPQKTELTPEEKLRKIKFLKRFIWGFIELFPTLFISLLLIVSLFAPKEVYLYFSQDFLIVSLIFIVFMGGINLVFYLIKRKNKTGKQLLPYTSLIMLCVINLLLFCLSFYIIPVTFSISNAKELQILLKNAPYSNFELAQDIDLENKNWKIVNFYGNLDGKGNSILNVKNPLMKKCSGNISDLTIQLNVDGNYLGTFGGLTVTNSGEIQNCSVEGILTIMGTGKFGGLVGRNEGILKNCKSNLNISAKISENSVVGGLVAYNEGEISRSFFSGEMNVTAGGGQAVVGGLVGWVRKGQLYESYADCEISVSGDETTEAIVGGLSGINEIASHDNFAKGLMTINSGKGGVGGLFGRSTTKLMNDVTHSYALVTIQSDLTSGLLTGELSGRLNSCFGYGNKELCGKPLDNLSGLQNCLICEVYSPEFAFSEEVWDLSANIPVLKWTQN